MPSANGGGGDPFVGSTAGPMRFASFDTDQFSMYSSNSPTQAKRALEAHLKDTDRRIQDASRLGTTLLQQRKDLTARLKDVEQVEHDNDVPADLRKKLAELEREYNEVGKESARAFLPKSRGLAEGDVNRVTPSVLTGQARESPTKVSAPSRKQRNQPSNRVHDIEFATEISTSLLAQVRQLQSALAEKDDALKDTASAKAQLEAEAAGMVQRIKHMDDNEQRYKDENWNLETKLQDMEAGHREITDKHDRLTQNLKATQSEKSAAQRELEDLRVSHERLSDEHETVKRQQEADLNGLRRDATSHQSDKQILQKKVEELTAQNTELARAVSSHWNQQSLAPVNDYISAGEDNGDDDVTPDHSEPASPVKGTPRHGMLESETLKSSLNHAHRMIQNLKNNIHREKTEKIELKRMLQDARDELESRRGEAGGVGANMAKKRKGESDAAKFKKPARPDRLGANRSSTTEILEDEPDWEDHDGERTPSKSRFAPVAGAAVLGAAGGAAFDHESFGDEEAESTDAFETANERDLTTENEAFETGNEDLVADDSDDLTETEGGLARSGTIRGKGVSPLTTTRPASAAHRPSFLSTASDEEEEEVRTPVTNQAPKYRLRLSRGNNRRPGRVSDLVSDGPGFDSPASSNGTPQPAGQSLGDELDAMDDDSQEGTPSRFSEDAAAATPDTQRHASVEPESQYDAEAGREIEDEEHEPVISSPTASPEQRHPEGEQANLAHQANAAMLAHEFAIHKPDMVDAGVMTEPWEPETRAAAEQTPQKQSLTDRAGEIVGGALAGFGLGRLRLGKQPGDDETAVQPGAEAVSEPGVDSAKDAIVPAAELQPSEQTVQSREPDVISAVGQRHQPNEDVARDPHVVSPPLDEPKSLSRFVAEPLQAAKETTTHREPPVAVFQHSAIMSQETIPVSPPSVLDVEKLPERNALQDVAAAAASPEVPLAAAAPLAVHAAEQKQDFAFSPLESQDFEPSIPKEAAPRPIVPRRSSRRLDELYAADAPAFDPRDLSTTAIPGTDSSRPGTSFFSAVAPPPLTRSRSRSMPASQRSQRDATDGSLIEPRVFGGVRNKSGGIPMLVFGDDEDDDVPEPSKAASFKASSFDSTPFQITPIENTPFEGMPFLSAPLQPPPNERSISTESMIPVTKPLQVRRHMTDEGSQTAMSGDEIDDMMRNKSRTTSMTSSVTDAGVSPVRFALPAGSEQRRSVDGAASGRSSPLRAPRRPASVGSMRNKAAAGVPPPLPENFTAKIVAAQKIPGMPEGAMAGSMGPPSMPASAYRQGRPKTPADRAVDRSMSRDGTTPRPVRPRDSRNQMQGSSVVSRRTSVSSFASELDERFNITRGERMYPSDVPPATDPRMIQAITQTMIGEYLWKYTRKAGRSETSTTRHRRFFWVHPYTRTLYWSEQDPSTAGRNMLKAKSVAIEAVRVITDDNTYPPGLHRKSLVVVTPGREIVFTAPTGQRHETWFNALSYLLLRTEQEKEEAGDTINQEDIDEFNPGGFSLMRSISRMTGRGESMRRQSRQTLNSSNSRTMRTSSPQKRGEAGGSLAQRQSAAAQRTTGMPPPAQPTLDPKAAPAAAEAGTTASRTSTMRDTGSMSGRLSSLTSRFRPSSSTRGSFSTATTRRGRSSMSLRHRRSSAEPSEIYDASVVGESAEDLRAVIERQEREADRLENVRACCDG